MTTTFGALNIQIPDGVSPGTPSSGAVIASTSGALTVTNTSTTNNIVTSSSVAAGTILVGNGTNYSAVALGTIGQVAYSNGSTIVWGDPVTAIYSGSIEPSTNPITVTNAAITTDSIVITSAVMISGGGTVLAPCPVTSIADGSFVIDTTFSPDEASFSNVNYFFSSATPYTGGNIYTGVVNLSYDSGSGTYLGTVTAPNITSSTIVLVTGIQASPTIAGVDVLNLTTGSFQVVCDTASVAQVYYMYM